MNRRLISERTRAGLVAARARGRAGGRTTVMTPERLTATHAMGAQGMTLIQIAATLGVGRSSLVRALARATDGLAGAAAVIATPEQTVMELLEPADHSAEPPTTSDPGLAMLPEI